MSDEIKRMAERAFRESIALGRIERRIAEEKRMSDETQPLTEEQVPLASGGEISGPAPDYRKAWSDLAKLPLFQAFAASPKPAHVHGPFTFIMNQHHNALRGCITCGAAWVGIMMGHIENHVETLCWHPVAEAAEEE